MNTSDFHLHSPTGLSEARFRYHHERFSQLNNLVIGHSNLVWDFLKTVNGGGAAAILAYVAAIGGTKSTYLPWISLASFSLGLALVGVALAILVHKADHLMQSWLQQFELYLSNELSWSDLIKKDKERVDRLKILPWFLGWSSLLLFFAGLTTAAAHLLA